MRITQEKEKMCLLNFLHDTCLLYKFKTFRCESQRVVDYNMTK